MAVKLLTVEEVSASDSGLSLRPGVPLTWLTAQPELAGLIQGCPLELRRPDGSVLHTTLFQYGASVFLGEDGCFQVPGDENGPIFTIVFTLPLDVRVEDLPPGTEVWVVDPVR